MYINMYMSVHLAAAIRAAGAERRWGLHWDEVSEEEQKNEGAEQHWKQKCSTKEAFARPTKSSNKFKEALRWRPRFVVGAV